MSPLPSRWIIWYASLSFILPNFWVLSFPVAMHQATMQITNDGGYHYSVKPPAAGMMIPNIVGRDNRKLNFWFDENYGEIGATSAATTTVIVAFSPNVLTRHYRKIPTIQLTTLTQYYSLELIRLILIALFDDRIKGDKHWINTNCWGEIWIDRKNGNVYSLFCVCCVFESCWRLESPLPKKKKRKYCEMKTNKIRNDQNLKKSTIPNIWIHSREKFKFYVHSYIYIYLYISC